MPLQPSGSSAVYWDQVAVSSASHDNSINSSQAGASKEGVDRDEACNDGEASGNTAAPAVQGIVASGAVFPINDAAVNNDSNTSRDSDVNGGTAETSTKRHTKRPSVHFDATQPHGLHEDEEEEEYTYNPDAELEDAQSAQHGYENAQFYEKIGFGDFSKYMANKRRKLGVQQGAFRQNAKSEQQTELLKGLRIHINGETEPPAHVLRELVILHGGVYVPYLDAKKTSASHIIASNLTPSKRIMFKAYKVVRAEWLLESIRDMKVKDWRYYREDQTPVNPADIGVAPAGTQIAQPKLSFGSNRLAPAASSVKDEKVQTKPATPQKATTSSRPLTPNSKSPRRLPPPTSDPLTVLHAAGAEQAETGAPRAVDFYTAQGWHPTKSNARSAALLKDEAWRLNETAVNTTDFLDKYYRESRLHWLSTWKAELKKMVGELSEGRVIDVTQLKKRKGGLKGNETDQRVILHVDFDSFFVSASLLSRPHLKGQPVVVCHAGAGDTSSSSEIASASYEAREFGIKNGMSLGAARSRCAHVQTVPYEFELYRSTSSKFYAILFSHSQDLEAVSIDEAYISLPSVSPARTGQQLLELAESIRSEIRDATGLETSIGVSHNKLLARLATNRAKPASSFQIGNGSSSTDEDVRDFLKEVDIETLPSIGWKRANEIEDKLSDLQKRLNSGHFALNMQDRSRNKPKGDGQDKGEFSQVGQLLVFSKNQLKQAMGEKTGEMLFNYARGIDARELETENVRKSVSAEVNYGIRFKTDKEVEAFLGDAGLAGELARRLRGLKYHGRQLTLKVMRRAAEAPIEPPKFLGHGICDTFNVSKALDLTNDAMIIGRTANELMRSLACPPEDLRGVGLQMQKLESNEIVNENQGNAGGQGRLTFQPVSKEDSLTTEKSPQNTLISLEDISSPILVNTQDSGRQTRSQTRAAAASYVDLSSEDGEDPEFKVLSQAPAGFASKSNANQTLLNGRVVKKDASLQPQDKNKAILIPATSPAQPQLPSPSKLSDKHLALLGLDPLYFHACSAALQSDLLERCLQKKGETDQVQKMLKEAGWKDKKGKGKKQKSLFAPVFEQAATNAAKREEQKKRDEQKAARLSKGPVWLQLGEKKMFTAPSFAGKSDISDLREILDEWMEGVGLDGAPELEEVEELAKFCLNSVSELPKRNGGAGPDVAKIVNLLGWWKHLIKRRSEAVSAKSASQTLAAKAWDEAFTDVLSRVNKEVQKSWSSSLSIQ